MAAQELPEAIRLVHGDGTEKALQVLGRCGRWVFVWWPGAGAYDVDLKTGKLVRQNSRRVVGWYVHEDDLKGLRRGNR